MLAAVTLKQNSVHLPISVLTIDSVVCCRLHQIDL